MAANTLDIGNAAQSNVSTIVTDYSIDSKSLDSPSDQKETEYINSNFAKQYGYYSSIPDLKSAIIDKAIWLTGRGWTANIRDTIVLESLRGFGKDSFNDIIQNMLINMCIGGDAYAEIIRDPDTDELINLKPLNAGNMKIIVDDKGIIKRYEQINKGKTIKFKPEEIFHLCNNRIGDQIHGISDIDSIEQTLLAEGESFTDMKKIMHRQAKPLIMFKLGTDNATKIASFIAKMDKATAEGENIYIPDDADAVSYEVVQVTPSPLVLNWRDDIRKKFYRTIGLPELLPGGGGEATESGGKIGYLAYQQKVEYGQRYIEVQIKNQLGIEIDFLSPESISPNLKQDEQKDPGAFLPSDTTAGVGE